MTKRHQWRTLLRVHIIMVILCNHDGRRFLSLCSTLKRLYDNRGSVKPHPPPLASQTSAYLCRVMDHPNVKGPKSDHRRSISLECSGLPPGGSSPKWRGRPTPSRRICCGSTSSSPLFSLDQRFNATKMDFQFSFVSQPWVTVTSL